MFAPRLPASAGHAAAVFSLFAGIVLVVQGSFGTLNANLTGGGALVIDKAIPAEAIVMQADGIHGAAPFVPLYESAVAASQLAMGVLLIVLGFFLHAFLMSRGERSVPVHEAPATAPKEDMMPFDPTPLTRKRQWYWIEMKI